MELGSSRTNGLQPHTPHPRCLITHTRNRSTGGGGETASSCSTKGLVCDSVRAVEAGSGAPRCVLLPDHHAPVTSSAGSRQVIWIK